MSESMSLKLSIWDGGPVMSSVEDRNDVVLEDWTDAFESVFPFLLGAGGGATGEGALVISVLGSFFFFLFLNPGLGGRPCLSLAFRLAISAAFPSMVSSQPGGEGGRIFSIEVLRKVSSVPSSHKVNPAAAKPVPANHG